MPGLGHAILIGGWALWLIPFVIARTTSQTPPAVRVDLRARWGMLLEMAAYAIVSWGEFWRRNPGDLRICASAVFLGVGAALALGGTRALGKQWRVDAGLSADHELVRTGPYRIVRHPIYASMLAMLLGSGILLAPWPAFALALAVFLAGTEIRVRIEDGLLASRFGEPALDYQRRVSAYIPFLR